MKLGSKNGYVESIYLKNPFYGLSIGIHLKAILFLLY